ncbi:MAG: thermonuclease family protein [Clostridia bacterium]|nr:thermonuclease family protein [Clostridia bacterium]
MKRISLRFLSLLLLLCTVVTLLAACQTCAQHKDADRDGKCDVCSAAVEPCATHKDEDKNGVCDICYTTLSVCRAHKSADRNGMCDICGAEMPAWVDYVAQTKLDMSSETLKEEVTVKYLIDGDTTHFNSTLGTNGIAKARYLGVNTPESTGKIEEWGKPASNFTKSKLENAHSIIIESDGASWEQDSNGRYLLWIWYKPTADAEYRCLNLELLQEGLGRGASSSEGRYGASCVAAMAQAKAYSLYIFSGDKDETFPYDEAVEVSLKELRTNITEYEGLNVVVEGTVVHNSDWTVYVEDYDAVTDRSYGIQVFYGYISGLNTKLAQGNRVRITGTVQSFFGTYQISNLTYKPLRPEDPANTVVLSEGNTPLFTEIDPADFEKDVTIPVTKVDEAGESYEKYVTFNSAQLLVSSSVSMKDLYVTSVYTTSNTSSDDYGAMTLTCTAEDGTVISIRTAVLKDGDGELVTASYFRNKTIDVKGIVEFYQPEDGEGKYQIKAYTLGDFNVR